jgi:hypothetical protein
MRYPGRSPPEDQADEYRSRERCGGRWPEQQASVLRSKAADLEQELDYDAKQPSEAKGSHPAQHGSTDDLRPHQVAYGQQGIALQPLRGQQRQKGSEPD